MKSNLCLYLMLLVSFTLTGCGATTANQPTQKQTSTNQSKTTSNKPAVLSLLRSAPKFNLLSYANPGFENPIDGVVVKVRNDKGQVNLAEYGVAPEAALSGKQGLGIILANGGLKLSYGIYRLKNQIEPNKKYRFEFDARLIAGHAVLFTKVENSPWQRKQFKPTNQWQTVGNTIDGNFLNKGKPIHMHIDNIKGKETGILLVDNVRLYPLK